MKYDIPYVNGLYININPTDNIIRKGAISAKEGEEVIADLGDYTEGMEVQAVPEQTGEDADE